MLHSSCSSTYERRYLTATILRDLVDQSLQTDVGRVCALPSGRVALPIVNGKVRCYQQETFCCPLRNVEMSERGPFGSWEKIQGCGWWLSSEKVQPASRWGVSSCGKSNILSSGKSNRPGHLFEYQENMFFKFSTDYLFGWFNLHLILMLLHFVLSVLRWPGSSRQDVKPSGTETDEKAVAALIGIMQARAFCYDGVGDLWAGCVLQRGLLYQRKHDMTVFVCLGFVEYIALGWVLEPVQTDAEVSDTYYKSPSCNDHQTAVRNLEFLTVTGLSGLERTDKNEEFAGIPFKFWHSSLLTQVCLFLLLCLFGFVFCFCFCFLFVCLFACLLGCLFVCFFVCLFDCLFVCFIVCYTDCSIDCLFVCLLACCLLAFVCWCLIV